MYRKEAEKSAKQSDRIIVISDEIYAELSYEEEFEDLLHILPWGTFA